MKVIKNILSKGVSELIDELLCKRMDKLKVNSGLLIIDFAEIDMYNHIRINTNNFEKQAVEMLYEFLLTEITTLSIFIRPTKEINSIFDEKIDLGYKKKLIDIIIEMYESGTIEKSKFQNNTLSEILDIGDSFIQINNGTWEELNVRYFKKYIQIFEEQIKLHNIKLSNKVVKTAELIKKLTFPGLFKDEYKGKIQLFYSRLIANGFIDKNQVWRENANKNEPAKVYFWLLDKGVMKTANDDTNALICFCKEFGITAYKDTEPTPPADVRAVTVKNLLNAGNTITADDRKRFVKTFEPFLIK